MRDEITDYREALRRAESNTRLRGALRFGIAIVFIIYLGLAYSLAHVRPGEAEYVVSILTLFLNTLLFGGMMIAALALKKRHRRYEELMKQFQREDRADPWIVRTKNE